MLGLSAFRRKPRQFEYKPRHYDYEREQREQRRRQVLGVAAVDDENEPYKPGQYIKKVGMHRKFDDHQQSSDVTRRTIIRLIIVVALLGFVAFWLFNSAFD